MTRAYAYLSHAHDEITSLEKKNTSHSFDVSYTPQ